MMIKQLIHDQKYALPVYNFDKIDDICDEIIEFQINDQLFFEVLKFSWKFMGGKTVSYATHEKREETRLEKQLTEEIRILENNINANNVTLLEEKKTGLQMIRNSRLEVIIVR